MNIGIYLVFALLLIVCALLLLVVLMQRPKQEGLGAAFGSQMTDQAFGARTTDVLKKGTVLFGTLFMILSLVLGILINRKYLSEKSDLGRRPEAAQTEAPQPAKSAEPVDLSVKLAPSAPVAPTPASSVPAPSTEPTPSVPAQPSPAPAQEPSVPAEQVPAPQQVPAGQPTV